MAKQDYYTILEIGRDASQKQITSSYRSLAQVQHPDKNGCTEEANEAFQSLGVAYSTLKDPTTRVEYDNSLPPSNKGRTNSSRDTTTDDIFNAATGAIYGAPYYNIFLNCIFGNASVNKISDIETAADLEKFATAASGDPSYRQTNALLVANKIIAHPNLLNASSAQAVVGLAIVTNSGKLKQTLQQLGKNIITDESFEGSNAASMGSTMQHCAKFISSITLEKFATAALDYTSYLHVNATTAANTIIANPKLLDASSAKAVIDLAATTNSRNLIQILQKFGYSTTKMSEHSPQPV